jgi:DNA-binding CsgD family transcriptional regulator
MANRDRGDSGRAIATTNEPDDSASVEVALLDRAGVIVFTNASWRAFALANGGSPERTGPGMSYLEVCEADPADAAAGSVAAAIRSALAGDLPAPLRISVHCDSPDRARVYDVLVSSRMNDEGACVGATVTLSLANGSDGSSARGETVDSGNARISAGELARLAGEVLPSSPFPALVLEVPSEVIVAASPSAAHLLAPEDSLVVGHRFGEFTTDSPVTGVDVFVGGRVNGFETARSLRRSDHSDVDVRMWVRSFASQPTSQYVLVVMVADVRTHTRVRSAVWDDPPPVLGMANAGLMIERISADAEEMFARPVTDILGISLLALVAATDVADLLVALSEVAAKQVGVTLSLSVQMDEVGPGTGCEVLILPLQPAPSCAFIFVPHSGDTSRVDNSMAEVLSRLGRGAEIAHMARNVLTATGDARVPGVERLSTRELQIVTMLLEGTRAPAIAHRLYLSQSTIRNHLAAAFAKLGVASQQELLDLFRSPPPQS